ncbi:MAG TPA: AI-2E family transporter [Gaiellaceae bacterium]|jgi:predicted PurR-regulated permease PerM|nr:AI-2E family transporter [Gaiellaceae bacterium]
MVEERHVEERLVSFRPRAILVVLGIILTATAIITFLFLAWHIITWILIALFLSLALNPAVEFFEHRGLRRSLASLVVFVLALVAFAGLGALLIPPLIAQIEEFVEAVPDFVEDLTAGRGPLGFLQDDYQIVDKVREAVEDQGAGGILGVTNASIAIARGVVSFIVGTVTIAFLTIFMLIEGPSMIERFRGSLPEQMKPRFDRVGGDIYRTVGGYVGGNLLISLIAGVAAAIVLFALGSSYAIALAVVVALFDLIPLAGATIAAVIVSTVAFIELGWVRGVILVVFFVLYQQLENHILQPVIYGRTVQLSPLTVLIAILIGAELVGILGALAAIPVAGIVQAIFREIIRWRRESILPSGLEVAMPDEPATES